METTSGPIPYPPGFEAALRKLLPLHAIIDDQSRMGSYLTEWRGKYQGVASLIARPSTAEQLSALVKLAAEFGVSLVPQGGNTGLVGASLPGLEPERGPDLLVSLSSFNRIDHVDAEAGTITAGAGVTIKQIQAAADRAGMMFPLSLASEGSCTVGGTIATNAGGIHVIRYGSMRALTLGVEAVMPCGEVIDDLAPLIKDNSGYAVRDLLVGSEGTLGFITRATVKMVPREVAHVTLWMGVSSLAEAVSTLGALRDIGGGRLSAFEVMADEGIQLAEKHVPGAKAPLSAPWHILAEFGLAEQARNVEQRLLDWLSSPQACLNGATMARNERQRSAFWRLRESLSEAQKKEGVSIKHDISLPISSIPAFVAQETPKLEALWPGSRMTIFGHLGDGNLHYNLMQPPGDSSDFQADWEHIQGRVHEAVAAFGGSISAEHGIGRMKRRDLATLGDAGKLSAMKAIKTALDPAGIMNPGVLFD